MNLSGSNQEELGSHLQMASTRADSDLWQICTTPLKIQNYRKGRHGTKELFSAAHEWVCNCVNEILTFLSKQSQGKEESYLQEALVEFENCFL